jgi:GDP-D-mannose 3',5'-epimerase
MKNVLVLGGGGFIGGHLAKKLFDEGNFVRVVDLKKHEYFKEDEYCTEFIQGDLRDSNFVKTIMLSPNQTDKYEEHNSFDEVYQLAADMGGAGYIFTGEHDADVMHNSASINLNVSYYATLMNVKKIFYSSSACIYPEHNQMDSNNPNCLESSAYPANPDSEYGWEKLFSERLYFAFNRNYGLNVRIARFHNIFGPYGTWFGGKEKVPAAICRKVSETPNGGEIEVWGNGLQTRSFLYIDECIEAVFRLMDSDFIGPVNIGSEEMVTINQLAQMVINISGKNIKINNISGDDFIKKYGFKCPIGVKGRNSDNKLYQENIGWSVSQPLIDGLEKTFRWIDKETKLSGK